MLELQNIQVSYYKNKLVLNDLSMTVNRGEIFGIVGMNGAGKTTLFNTIYGWVIPDRGNILFNNRSIDIKDISYLETENYFYPFMRGREYLSLSTKNNYHPDLNNIFDLPLDELVDHYSSGMKKKLAFWAVYEMDNNIVILDEPFNGVDIESVECFYLLIEKLQEQQKIILISSHIIENLTRICDRIGFLNNGKIENIYNKDSFSSLHEHIKLVVKKKVNMVANR